MNRLEFILAPAAGLRPVLPRIREAVGETLDHPCTQEFTIGRHLLIVCGDGCEPLAREPHERFTIREGWWPDPAGLQIEAAHFPFPRWSIEPDHLALRPLFYGHDASGGPIIATRPDIVAALIGAPLSLEGLAEQLLIGFPLEERSVFENVHRVRPGEVLSWEECSGFRITRCEPQSLVIKDPVHDRSWIDAVAPLIIDAFERGDALELSAGVDSRLVLAIGLAHGARPHFAFTLGGDDEESAIAREICCQAEIPHATIPVHVDAVNAAAQGRCFARRSGFAVSVSSYAWLPAAFDRLATLRSAQIGGGGGECAAGFYYSPFDDACTAVQRAWVRRRLFRSGVRLEDVFPARDAAELQYLVEGNALKVLRRLRGSWRQRTDAFYLTQRVPNAGGAVLSACACWYLPLQPLLHRPYIEWGRQLPTRWRANRRIQMRIIDELAPELSSIPFSHGRRFPRDAGGRLALAVRDLRRTGRKVRNRLSREKPAADLGAATVAEALAADGDARTSLHCLPDMIPGLDRAGLDRILDDPVTCEHELGMLLNTAFAAESITALRRELVRSVRQEPRIAA